MKWKFMKPWNLIVLIALVLILAACGSTNDTGGEESVGNEIVVTAVPSESTQSEDVQSEDTQPESAQPVAVANEKLNLNEASGDDYLATIPDFGNRMVREFMEYRPYVSIQQFRREIGKYVSDEQVAAYEMYVYVPVDVDNADAETIMQIPGVDTATAQTLMAARPFNSNDAFLAKLAELAPDVDTAVAKSYLVQ